MRSAMLALAAALVVSAASALAHEARAGGVTITHPWARATPGGSNLTAAFMEIKSENADKLISAASPVAGRVEVHTHIKDGDVMKMRRVDALEIAAGGVHVLKPMSDHIMLMDLKQPLKEGDIVKLTLTFEKAGVVEIDATVEPVGAMGPHGMDKQPSTGAGEHHNH